MDRYDRQLRLWGKEGQSLLDNANICVVGDESPLLQEVWKNLVLSGVSKFTWMIENTMESSLQEKDLFSCDFITEISALHPSGIRVKRKALASLKGADNSFWFQFSLIIIINCSDSKLLELFNNSDSQYFPPIITTFATGLYGYLHTYLSEPHFIIESHPDNPIPELRLDQPWKELSIYLTKFQVDKMNEFEISELPYPVLLFHCVQMAARNNYKLTSPLLRNELRRWASDTNPTGLNDPNYIEAYRFAHLAFTNEKILIRLNEMIQYGFSMDHLDDPYNRKVIALLKALGEYINREDFPIYPIMGTIPDMSSSTKNYIELKQIYQNEGQKNTKSLQKLLDKEGEEVPFEMIKLFCANLKYLNVIKPTASKLTLLFSSDDDLLRDLLAIQYNLNDIANSGAINMKAASMNSYPTASFMGGVVGQEAIKLITHQYIPLDNIFTYDGLKNETKIFRI
ncbi:hypothetical protein NCAS_0J00600 [Naumovozyma castellii]|uniref:NEDD8-activating enzyme E1 regulatory subunit n=1 Tax=Naumovozyma castellii TaxID=27288 RepID=G0VKK2_NAUCA|nr:hypothetical protein NCAS_0J00600 [Naumovozyma castellii CBS 4309]CCC72039.1 hypothetical protein NCAS_0J00600 [Naumovozyma castellii CBS 4309]